MSESPFYFQRNRRRKSLQLQSARLLAGRAAVTWILFQDCTRFNATTNQFLGFDIPYKFCYIKTLGTLQQAIVRSFQDHLDILKFVLTFPLRSRQIGQGRWIAESSWCLLGSCGRFPGRATSPSACLSIPIAPSCKTAEAHRGKVSNATATNFLPSNFFLKWDTFLMSRGRMVSSPRLGAQVGSGPHSCRSARKTSGPINPNLSLGTWFSQIS